MGRERRRGERVDRSSFSEGGIMVVRRRCLNAPPPEEPPTADAAKTHM